MKTFSLFQDVYLKKKKSKETESSVGEELSHGGALLSAASPSGAVALGALSLPGEDKNAIVAVTTALGVKNSNRLYFHAQHNLCIQGPHFRRSPLEKRISESPM